MKKTVLLILDGWGKREEKEHNAIKLAKTPNFDKLLSKSSHIAINASGEFVGLPDGQMGNSEVGHQNIGAGRVVYQDLVLISKDIREGKFQNHEAFKNAVEKAKKNNSTLHLMALVSDGGVHSHIDHLKGIAEIAHKSGVKQVLVHAFADGRDTPPNSGKGYVSSLNKFLVDNKIGCVADICGRFYAMDRDKRWDRVEKAYKLLTEGVGEKFNTVEEAFDHFYKKEVFDEFVEPSIIGGVDNKVKDGDVVFFCNFRSDRAREISHAFADDNFDGFARPKKLNIDILTMTKYEDNLKADIVYKPRKENNIFGQVLAANKVHQLRIAETEKYAHVTFFFNGGVEEPFEGEVRELIPSPKEVKTYDEKPEMSVYKVADKFVEVFGSGKFDVAIMNFANPDMIGHTGIEAAAIKAVEAVDECLGKVMECCDKMGATLLVTADHGNCEEMWDYKENQPHTAHTTNPVYLALYNSDKKFTKDTGKLADIAPTMLTLLGIKVPSEMTGTVLV